MRTSPIKIAAILCLFLAAFIISSKGSKAMDESEKSKPLRTPRTFLNSPGWKRAEKLGAIQQIQESATHSGVTVEVKEILADIDKTYVVTEIKGKPEMWEITRPILTDDRGRCYDFIGGYNDCGVLMFKPLNDDSQRCTLKISKIGLINDEGTRITSMMSGPSRGKIEFPADVEEKLKSWGFYEELKKAEAEETGRISDEELDKRDREIYKEILTGEWRFTFPVRIESRKEYSSSKTLNINVRLPNCFAVFKKLTKGICRWFLEYDIVDREGRNEEKIEEKRQLEKFIQLVRESKSKEELLKKEEEQDYSLPSSLLPEFDFWGGIGILWEGKEINWQQLGGIETLDPMKKHFSFTPPEKCASWAVSIRFLKNVRLTSPLEFRIDLERSEKELRLPFETKLEDLKIEGSMVIGNIVKDFWYKDRVKKTDWEGLKERGCPEEIMKIMEEEKQWLQKRRLRIDYSIQCKGGKGVRFSDVSCIADDGKIYDGCVGLERKGTEWVESIEFPSSSKTAVLRVESLMIFFDPPIEVPME